MDGKIEKDKFDTVPAAVAALGRGEMLIIADDENRENEGDLVVAAEHINAEKMAFIIRHTGGVVCLALESAIADRLNLPPMVDANTSRRDTAFTVSIDAAQGITTGISAADRVQTVLTAMRENALPGDLARPGHIFPLRAQMGGVLWRAGHTEASVDLCKLAGLKHGAVISELMNEDGTLMRTAKLFEFAARHSLRIISVADLIAYRRANEKFIQLEAESILTTDTGDWVIKVYRDLLHDAEQVALIKGDVSGTVEPALVRVHSACMTGDLFSSLQCDCGQQLSSAMRAIEREGRGVILYMKQEGRGIGLVNKIKAYELQRTQGLDTVEANTRLGFPADLREYGVGAQILVDIGLSKIRLMTNNPKKLGGIQGYGLTVVEQVPIRIEPNGVNDCYLQTKEYKMGHTLGLYG